MAEIIDIKGVGPVLAKACVDNGYSSVRKIATAMLNDLVVVPGVNEARAKLLIDAAQALLGEQPATNGAAASPSIEVKAVEAKPENSEEEKKLTGKSSGKKQKKKDKKKKTKKKKNKKGKSKK